MGSEERDRAQRIKENVDAMIHTMRLHHRVVERRIDGLGVHHSQHRMLMKLSFLGKSASQKDLADALDVSPACVARALKPLSAAGLVKKAEGTDGRCNAVSVSDAGRRLVEDSKAVFRDIDGRMFQGVTDAELDALYSVLRRLQENLIEMEGRDPACGERREGRV